MSLFLVVNAGGLTPITVGRKEQTYKYCKFKTSQQPVHMDSSLNRKIMTQPEQEARVQLQMVGSCPEISCDITLTTDDAYIDQALLGPPLLRFYRAIYTLWRTLSVCCHFCVPVCFGAWRSSTSGESVLPITPSFMMMSRGNLLTTPGDLSSVSSECVGLEW